MDILSKEKHKILYYLLLPVTFFVVFMNLYKSINSNFLKNYWMLYPLAILIILEVGNKFFHKNLLDKKSLSRSIFILLFLQLLFIKNNYFRCFVFKIEKMILVIIIIVLLYLYKNIKTFTNDKELDPNELFNLFYINISKTHEIVMLINNKIMKKIEKEQISEEFINKKLSSNFRGKPIDGELVQGKTSKQNVYESFDVKMTKSIMLRTIYEKLKKTDKYNKDFLEEGDVFLFQDIELVQRNIKNTVMLLSLLRDSEIKDLTNDSIKLNINSILEEMLDDFTVDYTFKYSFNEKNDENEQEYIIRLPYKNSEDFENGYSHADLQLGKLSLIGIYRGYIDFEKKESISTTFLELISKEYKTQRRTVDNNELLKSDSMENGEAELDIDFDFKKLDGKYHLIDVIAIVQELNIKDLGDEN